LGYDYLALKALTARGKISSIGNQIGIGKESGIIYLKNYASNIVIKIL